MGTGIGRRAALTGVLCASVAGCAPSGELTDAEIRSLLDQRIVERAQKIGMVAVVVDGAGPRVVAQGRTDMPDGGPMTADTVFEIGSITKVLTALILADMAARGEVAMTDPVARHLPAAVRVPEHGKPITLIDLATYRSGLPNMPDDLTFAGDNPLAGYTSDRLYAFLSRHSLKYEPGAHYDYANLGFGLLGLALANRAGKSYEALLVERVCDPLGLTNTRITLSDDMRSHAAQGHDDNLRPIPMWDMPALAGAGAVRSTAKDLTVFLQACLGLRQTPLAPHFATLLATRRATGAAGIETGLGWFVSSGQWWRPSERDETIVWKTGRTGGFLCNIAFSLPRGRGALILCNGPATDGQGIAFDLVHRDFYPGRIGSVA